MNFQPGSLKDRLRRELFSPDDLSFNQNGEMSPRQLRDIRRFARFWFFCLGIYLTLMLAMCVLAIWAGLLAHQIDRFFSLTVFWALILGLFGSCSYSFARPYLLDLRENRVELVEGELHKHYLLIPYNRIKMSYFVIEIRQQTFSIPRGASDEIMDHRVYRLFYLPHSRKIVNLVRLSK